MVVYAYKYYRKDGRDIIRLWKQNENQDFGMNCKCRMYMGIIGFPWRNERKILWERSRKLLGVIYM